MKKSILAILLCMELLASAQRDSSSISRRGKIVLVSGGVACYGLMAWGMNELWYKGYERSPLHWIDDSREWLQMDKAGHSFSTYLLARSLSGGLESAGLKKNNSLIWGTAVSMLSVSTIEVFDGLSAGWGASASDLLANTTGAGLYAFQSLVWEEEKIVPKFSWHSSPYAAIRPEVLGSTFPERLLKDYNGQTLWLSFNLSALSGSQRLPPWLCLSLGYGAEGMASGYDNPAATPYYKRYRQYYLSLDADLKKINTGNKTINKVLSALNFIKVPFPALVLSEGEVRGIGVYF